MRMQTMVGRDRMARWNSETRVMDGSAMPHYRVP
jgi:hypothetical protein